ncbi:IclR family transcriptional regulator [Haloprofundus halobius]|uniref:IclR family transcriptional regulator n=1 Tax=Haloprofundus halobius TaxID=2876194 RepID=UPI001CCC3612|nr:IclR family transcriptional regulator [Haloprofundus halobius]
MDGQDVSNDGRSSLSVMERTFEIVEHLTAVEETGVTELANQLNIPKTTAHSYLKTLENTGYAINQDGRYRLSLRILLHGGQLRHSFSLFQTGRAEVDRLARETGEAVNLGVHEDGERVIIYGSEGENAIWDDVPVGSRTPLNLTAMGKAMLAFRSDEFVEDFVEEHGLAKTTKHSITDQGKLFEDLEATRQREYSIESEEHIVGVRAFGVPVRKNTGEVIGAMSVAGPNSRLASRDTEEKLVERLKEAVNIVELQHEQR